MPEEVWMGFCGASTFKGPCGHLNIVFGMKYSCVVYALARRMQHALWDCSSVAAPKKSAMDPWLTVPMSPETHSGVLMKFVVPLQHQGCFEVSRAFI